MKSVFEHKVEALNSSLQESLMYCLIQSHAFTHTVFSLALPSASEWCPVGNWLLWVPCLSHFPSLFVTYTPTHIPMAHTIKHTLDGIQKRHRTHYKLMQNIVLIGRRTWFIIISMSYPFCSGRVSSRRGNAGTLVRTGDSRKWDLAAGTYWCM